MSIDGEQVDRPSSKHRSKIDNDLFATPGLDGRCRAARRFKDILRGFVAELGGQAILDPATRLQVRNAALLAVKVEFLQQEALTCDVDQLALVRQANNLRRMLRDLGISCSRQRSSTPEHPLDYAARVKAGGV